MGAVRDDSRGWAARLSAHPLLRLCPSAPSLAAPGPQIGIKADKCRCRWLGCPSFVLPAPVANMDEVMSSSTVGVQFSKCMDPGWRGDEARSRGGRRRDSASETMADSASTADVPISRGRRAHRIHNVSCRPLPGYVFPACKGDGRRTQLRATVTGGPRHLQCVARGHAVAAEEAVRRLVRGGGPSVSASLSDSPDSSSIGDCAPPPPPSVATTTTSSPAVSASDDHRR